MKPFENQTIPYHVGQNLDIKDSVGKWINAEVLFAGNGVVYVHYSGWSLKYDEQIQINSPRILQQWQPGKQIKVNNRIDAYHPVGGWLQARVIQVGEQTQKNQTVKVHFFNYHPKYDRNVNLKNNNQVSIIGSRSKAFGMGKKRRKALTIGNISQQIKKLLTQRAKNLKQNLQINDLTIKSSQGDGNCLFRSISDQLYGNQEHHLQIRKICMDYISYQKQFFQNFISQDIEKYIQQRRQSGVWGDDVEIQAISEIYARPIEIYVFDNKPIRTFHEDNQQKIQSIKLAYVGCCHYDSIKPKQSLDSKLITSQFGVFEQLFMTTYKSDMMNIQRNRNLFSNCDRLQDTVEQHLLAQQRNETKIQDELVKALEASQTQALLQQIQKSQLKQLQIKYQQQKIQQQIKKIEQKQIEQAKKLSKNEQLINFKPQKPYWFEDLILQGFTQKQIWFAIQCKGFDPDAVQNFLLDNLCI